MTKYRLVPILLLFKLCLLSIASCSKQRINDKNIIEELKRNYNISVLQNVVDINYERLNYNAYQSYNYLNPDSLIINNRVIIDFNDSMFFASRIAKFPGIYKFSQQEFQKYNDGFIYDSLGVVLGNKVLKQNKARYNQVKSEVLSIINTSYIQDLIDKKTEIIDFKSTSNGFIVRVQKTINDTLNYSFTKNPLQLISVENVSSNEQWKFLDFNENFATKIEYLKNKKIKYQYKINSLSVKYKIPNNYLSLPKEYLADNTISNKELELTKIGINVYLISNIANDRNILYQVNKNKITVFGAPIADKFSEAIYTLISNNHPNAVIDKVYITHAHSDHIGGLNYYANKGAVIICDEYSAEAIKNYPKFTEMTNKFHFEYIENESLINNVRFYFPENSHSKAQSFAYFINEKLIYQGDFIQIPADNTRPKHISTTTSSFVSFLKSKQLPVKRIVCHHRNNNLDLELLKTIN